MPGALEMLQSGHKWSQPNKKQTGAAVLTLRKKHQELSEEIEEAQKGLATDDLHVTEMKKRKLKIKEEISRLQA